MILGKHITVVLPAYNASKTLKHVYREIPHDIVDRIILVDDCSWDETAALAEELGIHEIIVHDENKGYGGNQKTCYQKALELGTDIVIMLHPDYQYSPKLIAPMASMIASGVYDFVLGSRIIGNTALRGGMPLYKYLANRFLTSIENLAIGQKLSEYHTGYRAYSREVLEAIPFDKNSDDFIFDNQMIVQIQAARFRIGEISCPTKYFPEASSINFSRSCRYGLGVLRTSLEYLLFRLEISKVPYLTDIHPREVD